MSFFRLLRAPPGFFDHGRGGRGDAPLAIGGGAVLLGGGTPGRRASPGLPHARRALGRPGSSATRRGPRLRGGGGSTGAGGGNRTTLVLGGVNRLVAARPPK